MNIPRDSLSEVLGEWRVTPTTDPNFRNAVWRRIDRGTTATWPAYLRAHSATWSLAAMLVLGAAGFTGRALAQARVQADREALVASYLVELDPRIQALPKP
jgi:hypothetical protein